MSFHLTIEDAKKALAKEAAPFVVSMKDKGMTVEYFAPKNKNGQTPHEQDELYVIASASSEFVREAETIKCKTGDVLFVPAGVIHCFQNFSPDFGTWVISY